MSFAPYLHFDGTCAEAMRFYAELFGGTDMQVMTYSDAPPGPMPMPKSDRIMHSQFNVAGGMLMASDYPPGMPAKPQTSVSVMTTAATVAEGKRLFDALAAGGAVVMPYGPTFWSPGFGMTQDRFGTHWIIGAEPAPA